MPDPVVQSRAAGSVAQPAPVRALRRSDLDACARLWVAELHRDRAAGSVARFLDQTLLSHPSAGSVAPSLVWEADGRIVGMVGAIERRYWHDQRPVGLVAAAHLVADSTYRNRAVGALLLSRLMAGPQDVTVSVSTSLVAQRLWEGIGGDIDYLQSLDFWWVARRGAFAARVAARLLAADRPARLVARVTRAAATHRRQAGVSSGAVRVDDLDAASYLDALAQLADDTPLRPAYNLADAQWLFAMLDGPARLGEPVARVVQSRRSALGWYVAARRVDGVWQLLELWARRRAVGVVVDRLFADADADGAVAVTGRVEPRLAPAVFERAAFFRAASRTALHGDAAVVAAIRSGDALVSRFGTEWGTPP
jgi:hypothetical protein